MDSDNIRYILSTRIKTQIVKLTTSDQMKLLDAIIDKQPDIHSSIQSSGPTIYFSSSIISTDTLIHMNNVMGELLKT